MIRIYQNASSLWDMMVGFLLKQTGTPVSKFRFPAAIIFETCESQSQPHHFVGSFKVAEDRHGEVSLHPLRNKECQHRQWPESTFLGSHKRYLPVKVRYCDIRG